MQFERKGAVTRVGIQRFMRCTVVFLALVCSGGAIAEPVATPAPQIFAPGVVSGPANDGAPTFTRDGKTLLFTRSGSGAGAIVESHLVNGKCVFNHKGTWGTVMPLHYDGIDDNGGSTDNEPNLDPNGRTLYFSSVRSVPIHFPRTAKQAEVDLLRIMSWDNGSSNVWTLSLEPWLAPGQH